jgi:hypothetical protein
MNRDDIIRMALEAGFHDASGNPPPETFNDEISIQEYSIGEIVEDFAKLVAAFAAAAEREACAQVCESLYGKLGAGNTSLMLGSLACAAAIRARGNSENL